MPPKIFAFFFFFLSVKEICSQSVGVVTNSPDPSAILDATSSTQGFLPPRMTTAQRDAIVSPATGLLVYNTDANALNFFNGS
jgi:hypothetical protein